MCQIRGDSRSEPRARRRSQHGVQPGTGSLQWWLWGEARGPARGQLSSRAASRRARGEARGNLAKGPANQPSKGWVEQRLGAKVSVATRTKQDLGVFVLATSGVDIAFFEEMACQGKERDEESARDCANRDRRGADAQGCGRRLGASTTLLSLKSLCGERDCCVWWRAAVLSSLPFAVSALPGRSIL